MRNEAKTQFVHIFGAGCFAFLSRVPFALALGAATDYYAYRGSLFLLSVSRGAAVRPMIEGTFEGLLAATAIIIGVPLAVGEICRSVRSKRWLGLTLGLIGLVLCLSANGISDHFWGLYAAQRHIQFEQ